MISVIPSITYGLIQSKKIMTPLRQHKLLIFFFYLPSVKMSWNKKQFITIVKIDKSNLEHNAMVQSDNDKLSIPRNINSCLYFFFLNTKWIITNRQIKFFCNYHFFCNGLTVQMYACKPFIKVITALCIAYHNFSDNKQLYKLKGHYQNCWES